jgi:hypothetical protein
MAPMEFSGKIQFKDSAKNAYALRVFVNDGWRHGCIDIAVWTNCTWVQLCEALIDVEKLIKKKARISKPLNRGNLHLVRH